jgi:hypothetical protein
LIWNNTVGFQLAGPGLRDQTGSYREIGYEGRAGEKGRSVFPTYLLPQLLSNASGQFLLAFGGQLPECSHNLDLAIVSTPDAVAFIDSAWSQQAGYYELRVARRGIPQRDFV